MRTGNTGQPVGRRRLGLAVILAVAVLIASTVPARGEKFVTTRYTFNWDQKVSSTDTGKTDTRDLKNTLEINYKGFLAPVIENEINLMVQHEINSEAVTQNALRIYPSINLGYKASYWNAGSKRMLDSSNEPGVIDKTTDSYFVELFYVPPRTTLPDLKAKYTIDKEVQAETINTDKRAITLSSEYKPKEFIVFRGEYNRNDGKDKLKVDSDKYDQRQSGMVGIRHFVSEKMRLNTEYKTETSQGATFLTAGGETGKKEEQGQTWRNALSFRPFRDTNLDGSYDYEMKQNDVSGQQDITKKLKGTLTQLVGTVFDIKGEYTRDIKDVLNTSDDNQKIDDTYTAEMKMKFSKQFDFTLKYERKDTTEDHVDATKNLSSGSRIQSMSWMGELTPFWRASVSYDKTDTIEKEAVTLIGNKYSLKSTFNFKAINLMLDPSYDVDMKNDRVKSENTQTRDFKFKIAYNVLSTRTIEAKFEHTYGRKVDTAAENIQRTDNFSGTLTCKNPVPGWSFGFIVTRAATDTSNDDLPPDITTTFNPTVDFTFQALTLSSSYIFNKKVEPGVNNETFDLKGSYIEKKWDANLTYSYNRTFSVAVNQGYTVSLVFKYNL